MQPYDAGLKLLFRQPARTVVEMLLGVAASKWLDVELPKAQNLRMDLLGEDLDGNLHHIELQSTNDPRIDLRMAEYALGTYRLKGQFPHQVVLYVGEAPMNMPSELSGTDISARYRIVDIRDLDGDRLLASEDIGDNIIAILTRLRDHKEAIRTIVGRIAELPEGARDTAVQQLVILAGLRRLGQTVKEEVAKMPIIIDIMENDIIGPAIRQGLEEGRREGRREGEQKGELQGELKLLRLLIEKRFGTLPGWADAKLASLSVPEIEAAGKRIFDAPTIDSLLMPE